MQVASLLARFYVPMAVFKCLEDPWLSGASELAHSSYTLNRINEIKSNDDLIDLQA